jgi:RNA polymerase sigma-70 factor (ECF subfamily)
MLGDILVSAARDRRGEREGRRVAHAVGPEELGRLFDAHARALILYARQWCSPSVAEDAVQEAFLALARQREQPREVAAWLHRVVRNHAISWARKHRRRQRHEARAALAVEPAFTEADAGLTPEEASSLLEGLGPQPREAVVARVWGGLGFEQIGGLLGCSSSTAHRWYREGLERLHERIEGQWRANADTTRSDHRT